MTISLHSASNCNVIEPHHALGGRRTLKNKKRALDGQDPMLFLALVIEIFTIYFLAP